MTEAEWPAATDPTPMLGIVRPTGGISRRKELLFDVACCRRVWGLLSDERSRVAVDLWEPWPGSEAAERVAQSQILRCIFGNPFRPVALGSSWLTSTVVALAAGIYESHDFSATPVRADARMDAGCDEADILDHCHSTGAHVRGCRAIDLLLGKA